jgi:glycosyltransferase involved in cell wall biosynthesis
MDLPNPIHGMSNVNLAVKNEAVINGLAPLVINSVPSYVANLLGSRWWGIVKILHTILCISKLFFLSFFNIKGVLYRPINGGVGQIYDIVYLGIGRLFHNKIYIHHHSFDYLNNKSRLFSFLNKIAGKNAVHIVLGNKMKTVLSSLYNIENNNITIISNLAYFNSDNINSNVPNNIIKIGHLANLCTEKGADIFIDVCRSLHNKNVIFSAEIAGPFTDLATETLVTKAVTDIPELQYVGPLYNDGKLRYYKRLDCFVFPSKYKNEAEPLVLYEAANYGGLLIGSQRGCMKDVIHSLNGESFKEDEHLVANLVESIMDAIEGGKFTLTKKQERFDNFLSKQIKAKNVLSEFMKEIGNYGLSRS